MLRWKSKVRSFIAALILATGTSFPAASQIPQKDFKAMQQLIQVHKWGPGEKKMAQETLARFSRYGILLTTTKSSLGDFKIEESRLFAEYERFLDKANPILSNPRTSEGEKQELNQRIREYHAKYFEMYEKMLAVVKSFASQCIAMQKDHAPNNTLIIQFKILADEAKMSKWDDIEKRYRELLQSARKLKEAEYDAYIECHRILTGVEQEMRRIGLYRDFGIKSNLHRLFLVFIETMHGKIVVMENWFSLNN